MKKTAAVICPGRGTYTKTELGYLKKHGPPVKPLINRLDQRLQKIGKPTISELDGAERFSLKTHTPGEFASTLIYGCSAADFTLIDRDKFDIVAVTGNSMGWYSALGLAGGLAPGADFDLIDTMGSMMTSGIIGGQLIYPVVDDEWHFSSENYGILVNALKEVGMMAGCEVYPSINFGGYAIIGGNEKALQILMKSLPLKDEGRYPFILVNHAAFHTPMMKPISERAFEQLSNELFSDPKIPLVDGRGGVWQPKATHINDLRHYTLGHQVTETYDFSKAITVTMKEFAPDVLIILGPGSSSGGAVAQVLIDGGWYGLTSKNAFLERQKTNPVIFSMGREDQYLEVVR
jgi:[acyl-carrier-protein] S-malonyltransferase